jgi:hypothetical protein
LLLCESSLCGNSEKVPCKRNNQKPPTVLELAFNAAHEKKSNVKTIFTNKTHIEI